MLHGRKDYDRIQDPSGKIPADEPVFLLRAQDRFAPAVVRHWASLAACHGGSSLMVQDASEHADLMSQWQRARGWKIPDVPRIRKDLELLKIYACGGLFRESSTGNRLRIKTEVFNELVDWCAHFGYDEKDVRELLRTEKTAMFPDDDDFDMVTVRPEGWWTAYLWKPARDDSQPERQHAALQMLGRRPIEYVR